MAKRGSYEFESDGQGRVIDGADNLERLRRLFRDGALIDGNFGPGNPGDFDNGSWHILCHLAGGTGVVRAGNDLAWLAITHDAARDRYQPTLTFRRGGQIQTKPVGDAAARERLAAAQVVGFVEGSSVGHIFAREVRDPPSAFNDWPRQQFDRDAGDADNDGGTVWEQWCVTRDIRATSAIGDSALRAYLTLVSLLGGRYVAAVARGRREHEHPRHLAALVKAGFLDRAEATWEASPHAIPVAAERLLLEARPGNALEAVEQLAWDAQEPRYYMFERRIAKWSTAAAVQRDLGRFGVQ